MPRTLATGRDAGFTLLELMVVMAILVMVATLLPMALDRALPGHRVATTAERVVSMVREARGSSMLSGKPIRLAVQEHDLVAQDATTSATIGRPLNFPSSTTVSLTDLDGRAAAALVVYPDGSAQAVRFNVEDGGRRKAVLVSALTGRASLASGQ
jgi:general secretion pathway protein H